MSECRIVHKMAGGRCLCVHAKKKLPSERVNERQPGGRTRGKDLVFCFVFFFSRENVFPCFLSTRFTKNNNNNEYKKKQYFIRRKDVRARQHQ